MWYLLGWCGMFVFVLVDVGSVDVVLEVLLCGVWLVVCVWVGGEWMCMLLGGLGWMLKNLF